MWNFLVQGTAYVPPLPFTTPLPPQVALRTTKSTSISIRNILWGKHLSFESQCPKRWAELKILMAEQGASESGPCPHSPSGKPNSSFSSKAASVERTGQKDDTWNSHLGAVAQLRLPPKITFADGGVREPDPTHSNDLKLLPVKLCPGVWPSQTRVLWAFCPGRI